MEACAECIDWPDALVGARAPYLMRGGAAELVRALKYRGWTALARRMGRAMAPAALELTGEGPTGGGRRASRGEPPVLVAVPLSPPRARQRGFNQARLLARSLGGELGWPVADALRRTGRGRRQARLGRASRRENARGLFRARPPADTTSGPGAGRKPATTAVVVDDVVTTGATAAACADALARTGWSPVGAVAFARTVTDRGWHASRDG